MGCTHGFVDVGFGDGAEVREALAVEAALVGAGLEVDVAVSEGDVAVNVGEVGVARSRAALELLELDPAGVV